MDVTPRIPFPCGGLKPSQEEPCGRSWSDVAVRVRVSFKIGLGIGYEPSLKGRALGPDRFDVDGEPDAGRPSEDRGGERAGVDRLWRRATGGGALGDPPPVDRTLDLYESGGGLHAGASGRSNLSIPAPETLVAADLGKVGISGLGRGFQLRPNRVQSASGTARRAIQVPPREG